MKIYTVTEFNTEVDATLRNMQAYVQGEVSGFKISQGKWVTFELKDEGARMSCFMTTYQMQFEIEDGMELKIFGAPGLYVPYGKFSFRITTAEPVGEGALARALQLTKEKLEKEGVFSPEHKKAIPKIPESIGIITSDAAAAYTDVLRILNNRWSGLNIFLRPVRVQGADAPDDIVDAIEFYNKHHPVDVIILTRGGGSLEDLQAFNAEQVCRAVFASRIPIVCGVGHERDTTLAELAADVRASTPSNAAERVVPDKQDFKRQLDYMEGVMGHSIRNAVREKREALDHYVRKFEDYVSGYFQKFDQLKNSLRLMFSEYAMNVSHIQERQKQLMSRMSQSFGHALHQKKLELMGLEKLLSSVNPKAIMKRGYSITRDANGDVIKSVKQVKQTDRIKTQFSDGEVESWVEKIR